MYAEDDLLPLSGLQHIAFCERQWALIHIEQLWHENRLTAEGRVLHERVHEQTTETRNAVVIARGLPIRSFALGVSGQTDAVEFARVPNNQAGNTIKLENRAGWWRMQPVEYKRGRAKRENCDRIQLCAEAICLEEMFGVAIPEASLYYGEPRRRIIVRLDNALRTETAKLAARMHHLFQKRETPRALYFKGCESCSLKEDCLPRLTPSVASYYEAFQSGE